jgi:hypothetical protein
MSSLDPGASIFVKAFRISALTDEGSIAAGATTVTTKDGMKLSMSPQLHTGADIVQVNANDDIAASAKKGDKPKFYTISLELAKPDPQLEALICGGLMLNSSSTTLGEPTGLTVTPQEEGGTLVKGFYGYRASQFNAFGESKAEAEVLGVEAKNAEPKNAVWVSGIAFKPGAAGAKVYGRSPGVGQFLAKIPNIAKPKLKKAIAAKGAKKGVPLVIEVESVTTGIPGGTQFRIGSSPVTFKVLGYVEAGAATITVEPLEENAAEIKAEEIKAGFLDEGTLTPAGNLPESDTTEGPGEAMGYQAPPLGSVANTNGVAIEAWSYRYIEGALAPTQPFWWWVLPRVHSGHIMPRDLTNANAATIMEGIGIGNPHFPATGPTGEWPPSEPNTNVWQRIKCGPQVVPTPSYQPQLATV